MRCVCMQVVYIVEYVLYLFSLYMITECMVPETENMLMFNDDHILI